MQDDVLSRRDALGLFAAAGAGALFSLPPPSDASQTLRADYLEDPGRVLEGFVKTEGDSKGGEVVLWARGSVYAWLPHQGGHHLFDQEIFSIRRFVRTDDGWTRLSNEAGVYLDKDSGEILNTWFNPYGQKTVRVFHLKNSPVNRRFTVARQAASPEVETWRYADTVCFYRNLLVTRPADLKVADYPLHAQSDIHKAADLTNLFVNASDLANPRLSSVPMVGSNTRVGNWLPWMEMGQRRGWLITQLRSRKLSGIAELPPHLRDYWKQRDASLFAAPLDDGKPNETSWSYFKSVIDAERGKAGGTR